jgi:tagatose 6-phosphate kinase
MILCIGPTPAEQRVMVFRSLVVDQVNRAVRTVEGTAGKSLNVAKTSSALGQQVIATGFLGGTRGERLRSSLEARGIRCDFVETGNTRLCITVIDETNGTQTELVEESQRVEGHCYERLEQIVRTRIKNVRAAIMSGTLTPGGPPDFYFRCTEIAKKGGAMSVVDAQGPPLIAALDARPDIVKPNRAELAASLGKDLGSESLLMAGMSELHERGAERVVITAGKAPTVAYDGKTFWRIFSPTIKAVNPIGSGDAFTSGLVWRLLEGDDLGQACRWAAAAGAANALSILAGEIEKPDVERLFHEVHLEKIVAPAMKN